MKLDYDCARNIMLTIEALQDEEVLTDSNCTRAPLLKIYPAKQINYTVERLIEAGFIPSHHIVHLINNHITYQIDSLTWEGHQYLDCIRDNAPWEKSHKIPSELSSIPFKIMYELALQYIRQEVGLAT